MKDNLTGWDNPTRHGLHVSGELQVKWINMLKNKKIVIFIFLKNIYNPL